MTIKDMVELGMIEKFPEKKPEFVAQAIGGNRLTIPENIAFNQALDQILALEVKGADESTIKNFLMCYAEIFINYQDRAITIGRITSVLSQAIAQAWAKGGLV
jgi:hypothetical protein